MDKITKDPKHRANLKKFGHDMSQQLKFTSSVGQLLPVYSDFLYPGDKVRFSTEMYTKILHMEKPTMMGIKEHVDWFFVPLKSISSISGDQLFGISDYQSSLFQNIRTKTIVPMFDFENSLRTANEYVIGTNQTYADIVTEYGYTLPWDEYDLTTNDEYGVPCLFNTMRLFELFGYGRADSLLDGGGYDDPLVLNTIRACAYQKIFFDCYRITDRQSNVPEYYNLDDLVLNGNDPSAIGSNRFANIFAIRYRPFERDYFTLRKVAPLQDYGDIGMSDAASSLVNFNNWLGVGNQFINQSDTSVSFSPGSPQNTANLRGIFAVEKLMQITRRAAKRYDAQVLAHFGVNVPHGISDHVYRLGSEVSIINVSDVIATASSSNADSSSNLGEYGGRANGYTNGNRNSFTAPCHGVLMAVYSAVPSRDYENTGLDRFNTYRQREDFFIPSLEHLGMQPMFRYEIDLSKLSSDNSQIIGWTYRYAESKLKYNRVCGAFNYDLAAWSLTTKKSNALDFWIAPYYLDSVLSLSFNRADDDEIKASNCFNRDPLIHWFNFKVYKSSEMSPYSLPQL